jgi:hypothetical protein
LAIPWISLGEQFFQSRDLASGKAPGLIQLRPRRAIARFRNPSVKTDVSQVRFPDNIPGHRTTRRGIKVAYLRASLPLGYSPKGRLRQTTFTETATPRWVFGVGCASPSWIWHYVACLSDPRSGIDLDLVCQGGVPVFRNHITETGELCSLDVCYCRLIEGEKKIERFCFNVDPDYLVLALGYAIMPIPVFQASDPEACRDILSMQGTHAYGDLLRAEGFSASKKSSTIQTGLLRRAPRNSSKLILPGQSDCRNPESSSDDL